MKGVQEEAIRDIFRAGKTTQKSSNASFFASYFEIYRGKVYDLLNSKEKLEILEDANNEVQIQGLMEVHVNNEDELQNYLKIGNSIRTTHCTAANDESSRSHAICQIVVKNSKTNDQIGKLKLVDLAGSERAQDTQSNNRQRRLEGADINKSLLALKECIRAFDNKKNSIGDVHVPFRASKLTMILRDSFNSKNTLAKIVMVACINPGSSSADHTLNTLRYSGRLKASFEKPSSAETKLRRVANLRKTENDKMEMNGGPNSFLPPVAPLKHHVSVSNKVIEDNINEPLKKRASRDVNHNSRAGLAGVGRLIMGQNTSSTRSLSRDVPSYKDRKRNSQSRGENNIKKTRESQVSGKRKNEFLDPKNQQKKDIDYLRQTLRGNDNMYESEQMLDFAEKADNLMQEQDSVTNSHLLCVKEHSKLLQIEGKILKKVQNGNNEDEDIEDYMDELEIIMQKRRELDEMYVPAN